MGQRGYKLGGAVSSFLGGGAGSPPNTKSPGPRPTSIPTGILVHPAVWLQRTLAENWWELCPFRGGGVGSPSNWGLCPLFGERTGYNVAWTEAHLHAKCHLDPSSRLATIDMGRKLGGGSAPFLGRGAGFPSNTKSPELRPTSVPSTILIHPAVWLQ